MITKIWKQSETRQPAQCEHCRPDPVELLEPGTPSRRPKMRYLVMLFLTFGFLGFHLEQRRIHQELNGTDAFVQKVYHDARSGPAFDLRSNEAVNDLMPAIEALARTVEYDYENIGTDDAYDVLAESNPYVDQILELLQTAHDNEGRVVLRKSAPATERFLSVLFDDAVRNSDPQRAHELAVLRVRLAKRLTLGAVTEDRGVKVGRVLALLEDLQKLDWMNTDLRDEVLTIRPQLKPAVERSLNHSIVTFFDEFRNWERWGGALNRSLDRESGEFLKACKLIGFDTPIRAKELELVKGAQEIHDKVTSSEPNPENRRYFQAMEMFETL